MIQAPSLVRDACRKPGDDLTVLLFHTSGQLDARVCRALPLGRFYQPRVSGAAAWDFAADAPPPNLTFLPDAYPPPATAFDLVVCPFRPAVNAAARSASAQLQVPLVHLLVDPPDASLTPGRIADLRKRLGHRVIAPDDATAAAWGITDYFKAKNWAALALTAVLASAVGGPYQMRWGLDG
jgi:hypothetical protein